jgi:hypothetical protein
VTAQEFRSPQKWSALIEMLSVSFQHWQERHFAGYWLAVVMTKEGAMKALVVLTAAALALSCVAASAQYVGKGKAPPPPVVTKG